MNDKKELSIKLYELFVDYLKLLKQKNDRIEAMKSGRLFLGKEKLDSVLAEEDIEAERLKSVAREITPDEHDSILLVPVWWKAQGIDYDYSCKIIE